MRSFVSRLLHMSSDLSFAVSEVSYEHRKLSGSDRCFTAIILALGLSKACVDRLESATPMPNREMPIGRPVLLTTSQPGTRRSYIARRQHPGSNDGKK